MEWSGDVSSVRDHLPARNRDLWELWPVSDCGVQWRSARSIPCLASSSPCERSDTATLSPTPRVTWGQRVAAWTAIVSVAGGSAGGMAFWIYHRIQVHRTMTESTAQAIQRADRAWAQESKSPSPSPAHSSASTEGLGWHTVTVSGTMNGAGDAMLPVVVWQNVHGQWVSAQGNALLDAGGVGIIMDGTRLRQAGMQNNGQAVQEYGIGSAPVQGTVWPGLYVAPLADPKAYILANQAEPSGLGTAITDDGNNEAINIGGEILDQGQFVVNGSQWSWAYTPQS